MDRLPRSEVGCQRRHPDRPDFSTGSWAAERPGCKFRCRTHVPSDADGSLTNTCSLHRQSIARPAALWRSSCGVPLARPSSSPPWVRPLSPVPPPRTPRRPLVHTANTRIARLSCVPGVRVATGQSRPAPRSARLRYPGPPCADRGPSRLASLGLGGRAAQAGTAPARSSLDSGPPRAARRRLTDACA